MTTRIIERGAAAAIIGTLTLAVGGVGIAAAANGGSLTLGQSNQATATTTLKNSNGTALALVGPDGKPPLAVSNDQLVKKLNADQLHGLTPSDLSSGSYAQLTDPLLKPSAPIVNLPAAGSDGLSSIKPVSVFATVPLDAGTYAVHASVVGADAICWIDTSDTSRREAFSLAQRSQTASLTATVTVHSGQRIHTFCAALPTTEVIISGIRPNVPSTASPVPGQVVDGGMTAIKIQSIPAGKTATTQNPQPDIR